MESESHTKSTSFLLFRKLSKKALVGGENKFILKDISGEVKSSEMMGILGSSGSGKTTLLEICGGRNVQGVTGNVFIDGAPFKKRDRRSIAFVTQEDTFFESDKLTVKDMFDFSVAMRWPSSTTQEKKDDEVCRVLTSLDLSKAADSPICLVSGGERRRLSIGCEILCPNPRLVLVDEGTSGLDSSSASKVMKTLRAVAKIKGIPVMVTIHQPSLSVFYAFDTVLFLSDGEPVYYGSPHRVMEYLNSAGFIQYGPGVNLIVPEFVQSLLSIKDYDNEDDEITFSYESSSSILDPFREKVLPKDILIRVFDNEAYQEKFAGDVTARMSRSRSREDDGLRGWFIGPREESKLEPVVLGSVLHMDEAILARNYVNEAPSRPHRLDSQDRVTRADSFTPEKPKETTFDEEWAQEYPANWGTQFRAILLRSAKQQKSTRFNFLNVGQTLVLAVLLGIAFFQMPLKEDRLGDLTGYLFFICTYNYFMGAFSGTLEFLPERGVLKKERASGLYHVSAYLVAKQVSSLPVRLTLPTLLVVISLPMAIPYLTVTLFLGVWAIILLTSLTGEAIGTFVGTLTLDFEKAVAIQTIASLAVLLLAGFYVTELPYWLDWLKFTSPLRYSFSAVTVVLLTEAPLIECNGSEIFQEVPCVQYSDTMWFVPNNAYAIQFFQVDGLSILANCSCLLVFRFAFRLFTYLSLRFNRLNYGRA